MNGPEYDDAEIRERARKIREARMLVRHRRRRAPTMRELAEALGDVLGMGHASRVQDVRQRSRGGGKS